MSENKYLDYMEMPSIEQKQRNMFDDMTEGIHRSLVKYLPSTRKSLGEGKKKGRKKGV